jgi:hypothetical protein
MSAFFVLCVLAEVWYMPPILPDVDEIDAALVPDSTTFILVVGTIF